MSLIKTRLIKEKNILLENIYLSEQTSGTTQQSNNEPQIDTKLIKDKIKSETFCSKFKIPNPEAKKEIEIDGKKYNYYLTQDGKNVLCVDEQK